MMRCPICGRGFTPNHPSRVYCWDAGCQAERRQRTKRAENRFAQLGGRVARCLACGDEPHEGRVCDRAGGGNCL